MIKPLDQLLANYQPPDGVADELYFPDGRVRPVWQNFLNHVSGQTADELLNRFGRGDQYLRDAGVFYRQYSADESVERTWPLSHIPVLIDGDEWQWISEGLVQRADLLEEICADLYGANRLVTEGHLPSSLIASSREWLRPMVGVTPRSGSFLHFLAFEIGRGPDGTWWVLGDRTQAPSGAGFALENRVATSLAFADYFKEANIERFAGFFRQFRQTLREMSGDAFDQATIMTPGPMNDTYFEHTYIARYLGMNLLEGEDLIIEDGQVMMRTVEGPKPISVIWRRLDAAFSDPLELEEKSRLGTPGLVNAIRNGNVSMINALGAGVLEMRALLAFMPRICEHLRGESLKIPNVATWWCGQPSEHAHVLENFDRMMVSWARSISLPFEVDGETAIAGRFTDGSDMPVADWINARGPDLVGQEAVKLSTSPAFVDGQIVARPMSLRVFMLRTSDGWQVMPGGYARIGRTEDPTALTMQHGGSVSDVWVMRNHPVSKEGVLDGTKKPYLRVQPGLLPSRAADNLFWLGRYVERAEFVIRLLRAYHVRLAETSDTNSALLQALGGFLQTYGVDPTSVGPSSSGTAGLGEILDNAMNAAGKIRDRFSTDGWAALHDVANTAFDGFPPGMETANQMGVLLRKLSGFSGLVHENMYRFAGWRFLTIGRSLERAHGILAMVAILADENAPEGALDLAIEIGDSVMTHRRRYAITTTHESVVDLLALDEMNPRSAIYHLTEIKRQVEYLPGANTNGQMSDLSKSILKAHTALAVQTADQLTSAQANYHAAQISDLSELISRHYFR